MSEVFRSSEEQLWDDFSESDLINLYDDEDDRSSQDSSSSSTTLVNDDGSTHKLKRKRSDSPSGRSTRRSSHVEEPSFGAAAVEQLREVEAPVLIPARLPYSWSSVLRCAWGVLWEIARYGVMKTIDFQKPMEIEVFRKLEGTNQAVGPSVRQILLKESEPSGKNVFAHHFSAENEARSPWQRLDEEESCLAATGTGGTGCQSDDPALQLISEPFGGLVEFVAWLKYDKNEFKVHLISPQRCPSTRFSRRFGSKRFFRLRIPKNILSGPKNGQDLMRFVQRPFVIMNHVFRAFTVKDSNVFFVETFEEEISGRISPRPGIPKCTDPWPFLDFIEWHNPLECNSRQTMAKWASRFALGLSNSVPGVKLKPENVFYIPDLNSEAFGGLGKVPNEQIMTDGCGFANRAMMHNLRARVSWEETPTAIQCRLAGAKGLLLLHPDCEWNEKEEPMVWIRNSQTKINYYTKPNKDPAMLTIDVLRASHMTSPARLSPETIINLHENGVAWDTFCELFANSLNETIDGLWNWAAPESTNEAGTGTSGEVLRSLWQCVARTGAVLSARVARYNTSSARARGFVHETYLDDYDEEEPSIEDDQKLSTAWWPDQVSGQPSCLEETIMALLDSGFDPRHLWILRVKLKAVIHRVADSFRKRCKIPVAGSCAAFIVPDPFNVLGVGEIQVKSSHRFQEMGRSAVVGDVLVARHPCKLPSDMQKVKAVELPELSEYTDVVVFSTRGERSLASLLAGGDYDGDKVEVYWDPDIVDAFNPPSQSFAEEPPGLSTEFKQHNESVDSFLNRVPPETSMHHRIHELQHILLAHVYNDGKYVGIYNDFYNKSVYTKGYNHPDTILFAYKFTTILDGAKTGKHISEDAYRRDQKAFGGRKPRWNETEEEAQRFDERNLNHPKRPPHLGEFVMDKVQEEVARLVGEKLATIDPHLERDDRRPDEMLLAPHAEIVDRVKRESVSSDAEEKAIALALSKELNALQAHVDSVHCEWFKAIHVSSETSFTGLRIEERQDKLRKLSQRFALDPPGQSFRVLGDANWRKRIKASYAYSKWPFVRFPWDMSMSILCALKSSALPRPSKTITPEFYDHSKVFGGPKRR